MNGKYSDHAAQDLRSNDEMLSCCAFAQADLNIFFLAACNFTGQNITDITSEQRQLRSDYARACGMNMAKKKFANHVRRRRFIFDSACAGLSLSLLLS